VRLKALPPTGWGAKPPYLLGFLPSEVSPDYFKYAVMPVVALGMGGSALLARLTRASHSEDIPLWCIAWPFRRMARRWPRQVMTKLSPCGMSLNASCPASRLKDIYIRMSELVRQQRPNLML